MPKTNGIHYGWVIVLTGCFVVFGSLGLARFGYSIVLPAMQADLGMDHAQAGLLATADLFSYLLLSIAGGLLAARHGPRIVIAWGLACAGVGMMLTAAARGLASAAACRMLTGAGSGASNVPMMGLLAAWTTARTRGLAAGIVVAGSSLGLIVLGPTVPRLIAALGPSGWRAAWLLLGVAALVLSAVAAVYLRNRPSELGLAPLGATDPAAPSAAGHRPPLWRDVYRAPGVLHLGGVYTAFGFSYVIYMTFFVQRLVAEGGYSHAAAGRLFMMMGACSLICGVLWGAVSDRLGRRRTLVMIYLLHAVAFSLYALARSPAGFTVSAVLFGLSAWSIPAVMAAACGDVTGPRLAPAALGFVTIFFGIGQAAGPILGGAVADATGSLSSALLLAAAAAAAGALGSVFLRE